MEQMSHAWQSLPSIMSESVSTLSRRLNDDRQWQAFVNTGAINESVTIGVASKEGEAILVTIEPKTKPSILSGSVDQADFTYSATPEQWEKFFEADPKAPYTSFVSLRRMNLKQAGLGALGDRVKFAQYCHLGSRILDLLREGLHGPMKEFEQPEATEDYITGKYIWMEATGWGRAKVFYETAGEGSEQIVFLHTAGSDSRQYHGMLNHPEMRKKCTMYAFDLPNHGRSTAGSDSIPGSYTIDEDKYIDIIASFIRTLKLNRPIVCGASMAGQICIAIAIRNDEVKSGGTIPLQGCDHISMDRHFDDKSPVVNQALFNPDGIYGLMCPKSPCVNRQSIWQTYSAQAYGIFHGDLDFYFGGFDARGRVGNINVGGCPIYFLTGEYDWSTTPEMSKTTADKIKGAEFKAMKDLGHFPATENPALFVPYLIDAVDWIVKTREI